MKKLIYWKLCAKCCFKHFPKAVLSHLILLITVKVGILFIPILLEKQKQRDLANCPRGKWKRDSGQQQRRRPRIYRAGVSEAGCPHCTVLEATAAPTRNRHALWFHPEPCKPQSLAAKPAPFTFSCTLSCLAHANWAPVGQQEGTRCSTGLRVNHRGAGRRCRAWKSLFASSGVQEEFG